MADTKRNVYQLIAAVAKELSKTGISKSRSNQQQGYKFRGIDDTLNALSPMLADSGLIILPRMIKREMAERTTKTGNPLFTVVVDAEFDFVSAEDGSKHTAKTYGEAMDTADKATNKAMSVAYKYAAFLTFCIPLEGMAEDADTVTHEPAVAVPDLYEEWLIDLSSVADEGTERLQAAWKASKTEYRKHLTSTNAKGWEALKAKASAAREAVPA